MAQILKDDVRKRILDSAKEEFLSYDYEDASMRRIALRSKMTVGNLYRYFKNKEELLLFIVNPTYSRINSLIMRLTGDSISLNEENTAIDFSTEKLYQLIDALTEGLIAIHSDHPAEMNILMMGSQLNSYLSGWFANIITQLIEKNYPHLADEKLLSALSNSYAIAIFHGVKEILRNSEMKEKELYEAVSIYLRSYVRMLERNTASAKEDVR